MTEILAISKKRITPKAAIQKGKDLENYLADQLVGKGIDAKAARSHGSGNGNREKSDIWTNTQVLGRQAGFECKHVTNYDLPGMWRQTKKLEALGYEPILVIKQTHETYDGTKVVIYLDTFLDLIKAAREPEIVNVGMPENDRDRRYRLEQLKRAISEALKVLP